MTFLAFIGCSEWVVGLASLEKVRQKSGSMFACAGRIAVLSLSPRYKRELSSSFPLYARGRCL